MAFEQPNPHNACFRDFFIYRPNEETKNKKLLRKNPLADWELRVEPYRVFYEIEEPKKLV